MKILLLCFTEVRCCVCFCVTKWPLSLCVRLCVCVKETDKNTVVVFYRESGVYVQYVCVY